MNVGVVPGEAVGRLVHACGHLGVVERPTQVPLLHWRALRGADDEVVRRRSQRAKLPRDEYPPKRREDGHDALTGGVLRRLGRAIG
jgi:hypothetical protein